MYDLTMTLVMAMQFIICNSWKLREQKPKVVKICMEIVCSYKKYFVTKYSLLWGKVQVKNA